MSEYISREAVHGALAEYVRSGFAESASDLQGYTDKINAIPSADVRENIHGHWIAFSGGYLCSKCREKDKSVVRVKMVAHKYCPDCGAIMDEAEPKGEKGTE